MLQSAENANECDETTMDEEGFFGCLLVILWSCENAGECILHKLTYLYARQRFGVLFLLK